MSFGSKAPATPAPQPQTPVPQEDDPKSVEIQRKTAIAAQNREGYAGHLLSGSPSDTTMTGEDNDQPRKRAALIS